MTNIWKIQRVNGASTGCKILDPRENVTDKVKLKQIVTREKILRAKNSMG